VVVLVAGFLLMQRLWLTALALVLATATGGQMVWLIKRTIGRALAHTTGESGQNGS